VTVLVYIQHDDGVAESEGSVSVSKRLVVTLEPVDGEMLYQKLYHRRLPG